MLINWSIWSIHSSDSVKVVITEVGDSEFIYTKGAWNEPIYSWSSNILQETCTTANGMSTKYMYDTLYIGSDKQSPLCKKNKKI